MMGSARREPTAYSRPQGGQAASRLNPNAGLTDHAIRRSVSLQFTEGTFSSLTQKSSTLCSQSFGLVRRFVDPHSPDDPCDFVGQGDRGFVAAALLLDMQCPGPQLVRLFQILRSNQDCPRSVDQEHAQVRIASLADRPEPACLTTGAFSRRQTEETGEMPAAGKAKNRTNKADERCRRNQADSRDREQPLDHWDLGGQDSQLALGSLDALFKLTDLQASLGKCQSERIGDGALGVLDHCPCLGDHMVSAHWQEQSELAKDPADEIDPGRAVRDPGRAQPVQTSQSLLGNGLDGNWVDVLVPVSFEQALGIAAVGLVPSHIASDVTRGQEQNLVSELLDLASPEVRCAAGLEKDESGLALGEEAQEALAGNPVRLGHLAWMVRDGDLEDVLCQVNSDRSRLHGGLLLSVDTSDYGTPDAGPSQEESIPSLRPKTLLRHDVALYMELFPSQSEAEPPVSPGEPRGLNKERP